MLSGKPKLSVLLPAYNVSKYIQKAISSILGQSFSDFELLIADDGSTDNTRELIDHFSDTRIRTYHNSFNQGKTSTVNRLFKLAQGDFVTIHDADDESLPQRFEIQLQEFVRRPSLVFCGSNFYTIYLNGVHYEKSQLLTDNSLLKEGLFTQSQFHGPTIIFRRDAALKLNAIYRPFFKDYNEDYDFSFRLSEFGDVTNCAEQLYKYRITPNSLSRTLTVQKSVSAKLVQYLALQRKQTGTDELLSGDFDHLTNELKNLSVSYEKDKSLIFREQAELDFYYGFYKNSLINSFRAVKTAPFIFRNYRLIQHILRKRIFGF
jgi:glycosyltransferase involved in cell wall biosynthesis